VAISDFTNICIDGVNFGGYSFYDVVDAITYTSTPERTIAGNIVGLDKITKFVVTTIYIKYNLMKYEDYKTFVANVMNRDDGKVEFTIEYWDINTDTSKTKKFYLAPASQKEILYKRKSIDGIRNMEIEFISTNNEVS